MAKSFNELTFTDDYMFCRILGSNADLTKRLVEVILGKKISRIENLSAQQEFDDFSNAKGIRFDVYFEDDENNAYDVEMQTYNKGNLPKRSHYYHSMIAVDNLNKGKTYASMKNSYVIFICTFDPFDDGIPVYTVHSRVDENPEIKYEDGVTSVFLNCMSLSDDITPELKAFFKYVKEELPSDDLTNSIDDGLLMAKTQKQWRRGYMDWLQYREMDMAEGEAKGRAEGLATGLATGIAKGDAKRLVSNVESLMNNANLSIEEACRLLSCTVQEYEQAKELIKNERIK